ncbi:MAG: L,D-transpeptidase family protein [Aliarcobacter sp.]|jgi:murein L,D-transpeptidase YcbB/YkuD|nr:L,D-transpeptidase family protein [Aliarcobacter sp.]
MSKVKSIIISIVLFNSYLFANTITTNEVENKEKSFIEKDLKILNKSFLEKDYESFLISKKVLKDYYKFNNYEPFWIDKNGIKDISLLFLDKIKNDPVLGPKASKLFKLDEVLIKLNSFNNTQINNQKALLTIDFMITELYDKYFTYVLNGSINWKAFEEKLDLLDKETEIKAYWDRYYVSKNSKNLLKKAILGNDLSLAFKEIDFNYPHVDKLILAINDLQVISLNGGYTKIPEIKSLRIGDNSEIVKFLRQRLTQSRDLTKTCKNGINTGNIITNITEVKNQENIYNENTKVANEEVVEKTIIPCENNFDEDLKTAVISFQKKHGLYADGIVGSRTQKFLNMSADEKIEMIRLNLERMRWLQKDLGEKYLIVNIPEFKLKMIENNNVILSMAVVVGERKHPTPIFSDKMSYIVVNPKWNIPESITKKEIIPKLIKDPNYLASKGIDIYESWHPESERVNTQDIIDAFILEDLGSIPNFRLTQSPSSENPLGRMKFMFPNKHAVYLHDTPAKSLFGNARRAYSHGCIRLAKPQELMATIASEDKNINIDKINALLKESDEKSIGLNKKIPIHLVYLTSWVDEHDVLQFREDIYNYDKIQKELMY